MSRHIYALTVTGAVILASGCDVGLTWPQAVILPSLALSAAAAVDQEQPIIDATVGGLAIGGGSQQKLAQVITAGLSGDLTEVRFPVTCGASSDLVVEIQTVGGGLPSGVVLTSETIPGSSLPSFFPSPPRLRPLRFANPAGLSAGDQFAIVLRSNGSCGILRGPVGNPYAGGDAFFDARPNAPGWIPIGHPRFDLPFQTVMRQSVLLVSIDVKPGSDPNSINSKGRGRIPVAILGASQFDPAAIVDRTSLTFGATGDEQSLGFCSGAEDTNGDALLDLICHFETERTGFSVGDTEGILRGLTRAGEQFEGRDRVRVVK